MLPSVAGGSPVVEEDGVTFGLVDGGRRLAGARLLQEIGLPGPLDLARTGGQWRLRLPLPEVDRMEYLFEVEDRRGNRATITDPANPRRAPGAFGDKSVALLPGYREPEWLDRPGAPHEKLPLDIDAPELDGAVTGTLWSAGSLAAGEPAPLLVVHDGPEYAALAAFAQYLAAGVEAGTLPPLRAALLGPGDRNAWYSADPAYARTLCQAVLPAIDEVAPTTVRVGVGVSLGALAVLHAHWSHPGVFGGLMLQSGSFFVPALDPQERRFSGFGPVTGFVDLVHAAAETGAAGEPVTPHPTAVPVVLTCGLPEENLANNRRMAGSLRSLGYPTTMVERRDAHNYVAWRDALHPHLNELVEAADAA